MGLDMNALLAAASKKVEANRKSFTPIELTEDNVQAIFDRCLAKKETPFDDTHFSILFQKDYGYDKDSTPVTFSIEKIKQNKKIVAYLFGELPSVHTGSYIMDSKESIHKYDGKIWTTDTAKLMMLYHLGEATGMMGPFIKKYNSANIYDNRVKPTLSPKDPAFPAWWEQHKAEWED